MPLTQLGEHRVRREIALISQEVHVFAGTLGDDLRLAAPDATDAEITAALDLVGATALLRTLPDGLATSVGEGGRHLTAAQAQQLALARLVLAGPAVAVLDEATAEAGSAGARDLDRAAMAATEGRTTLIVAHRLSQAATADRIVVLEHGRITEQGTHGQLLEAGGGYSRLWRSWSTPDPVVPKRRESEELSDHLGVLLALAPLRHHGVGHAPGTPQPAVPTPGLQQLAVRAVLGDAPVLQHDDAVRGGRLAEPVGDDQRGATLGGRQAARSRSRAPALPASAVASSRTATAGSARTRRASASCWAWAAVRCRPPSPTLVARPSGRVRTQCGGADEVEGGGYLGVGGVRVGEPQVVGERPGEDVHLLADQGDLATEPVLAELRQRHAAQGHRASRWAR